MDQGPGPIHKIQELGNNKGNALNNLDKYDEAIKAFDAAIEIDPQFAEAWNHKGTALWALRSHYRSQQGLCQGQGAGVYRLILNI